MIRTFTFDEQTVPLHPSPSLEADGERLFSGDSMTLLVGPNGSGKTRAMITLASEFSQSAPNSETSPVIEWSSEQDKAETCAVFYTPVPYHIDLPQNNECFYSIKTSLSSTGKPLSTKHLDIANELKIEFGLDARRTLTLSSSLRRVLNDLMYRAFDERRGANDPWLEPFRETNKKISEQLNNERASDTYWIKYQSAMEQLSREFTLELRKKMGKSFAIKIRAYQFARVGRTPSGTAEKQLLEALGFSLVSKISNQPTMPLKKYLSALSTFQRIANIVNDPWLIKSTYQIDDEQVKRLKELPLENLGHISLTGLSSGAAALIHQFSSINSACERLLSNDSNRKLLLLIDEGDAFLHLEWQQRYVDYLDKTVRRLKEKFDTVQVVLATHSPILMSDFPRECIFSLNSQSWLEELTEEKTSYIQNASFGAPMDLVVRHVGKTGTMGKFATRIIRELLQDIGEGVSVNSARVEMIGDPIIKRQITKMIEERIQRMSE